MDSISCLHFFIIYNYKLSTSNLKAVARRDLIVYIVKGRVFDDECEL